jgi:hypothetical protein
MRARTLSRLITPCSLVAALAAVCALLLPAPAPAAVGTTCGSRDARLEPAAGVYFGASIDWSTDTIARYARRVGRRPATAVYFTDVPMSPRQARFLDKAVAQVRDDGGLLLLTLEPRRGLSRVTRAVARSLAIRVARYERSGVPVMVRFAHEMNGSWYPWAQRPAEYVTTFRRVASELHRRTRQAAMLWAPNYGGGYPFAGGRYQAAAGSADARALDTNGDGIVTQTDDPYSPFYPGDRYVDWVGMTLYHFGNTYPWGENEVPEAGKFAALLTGSYRGLNGDETAVPDFYRDWAVRHRKPLAIPETGALYAPGRGGAGQLAVKRAWWSQAFSAEVRRRFPRLRMLNWFEWDKHEVEINGRVDWTATTSPAVRSAFRRALPSWLRFADALAPCRRG